MIRASRFFFTDRPSRSMCEANADFINTKHSNQSTISYRSVGLCSNRSLQECLVILSTKSTSWKVCINVLGSSLKATHLSGPISVHDWRAHWARPLSIKGAKSLLILNCTFPKRNVCNPIFIGNESSMALLSDGRSFYQQHFLT